MPRAGYSLRADIVRISYSDDDDVGGAQVTGSCVYGELPIALNERRPSQQSLEQGLEVAGVYDLTCKANGVSLFERDEVQITWPLDHPHYGCRFRIVGVQSPRGRVRYRSQHATLSRIDHSRSRQ